MSFFNRKYRIVLDAHGRYEAQVKLWAWPYWLTLNSTAHWACPLYGYNSSSSMYEAIDLIENHKSRYLKLCNENPHKSKVVYVTD